MNRWVKVLTVLLVVVLCFGLVGKISMASTDTARLKALIVTGQSNPWHRVGKKQSDFEAITGANWSVQG
jgi:hypothetical protein